MSAFGQTLMNGLIAGSHYAMVALGFTLIFATVRFIPFSHAIPYTLAPYAAYALVFTFDLWVWCALPLAVGMGAAAGALLEALIYRRLRVRGSPPAVCLLASLGLVVAFQSIISLAFSDHTLVLRESAAVQVYVFAGVRITSIQTLTVFAMISLFAFIWIVQRQTMVGKMQSAVASEPTLALIVGIPVPSICVGTAALGSGLAAIAGLLAAFDTDLVPTMGFSALMMGVVAAIAGGVGSVPGALMGGLLLGLTQHLGTWLLPTEWQDAIAFAVLIAFLLFKPQGLLGSSLKRASV